MAASETPLVGIIMGSQSDMEQMKGASDMLAELDVPHEVKVLSAHRTPEATMEYARTAEERGLEVLIAGAGAAAALPGFLASSTILPVLGVPLAATPLLGMDALLSMVQMPKGVPVGTLAIGKSGAANASLFAVSILGRKHEAVADRLRAWRKKRQEAALAAQS